MSLRNAPTVIAIVATGSSLTACRPPSRTPDELLRDLASKRVEVRSDAAEHMTDLARCCVAIVAPEMVQAVIERFQLETDAQVRRDLMTWLVETGHADVRVVLDDYMQTTIYGEQRDRAVMYQRYAVVRGWYGPRHDFRRDWPYGTPGIPDPVNSGVVFIDGAPAPPMFTVKVELGATLRKIFDSPVYAFDFDNVLGARTKAGIWGVRMGMFQGRTGVGLRASQYRVGPTWEVQFEHVRPTLAARFSYLRFSRFTRSPGNMGMLGIGFQVGLGVDLWRHEYDHAVYLFASTSLDAFPHVYDLPGATVALGARY